MDSTGNANNSRAYKHTTLTVLLKMTEFTDLKIIIS